jgi:four helix bundle protein
MASGIENLKIYQMAERIEIFLHKFTIKFPADEKYRMIDQIRRASNAITSNIAEGYGRYTFKEKMRYMYIARGESFELKQLMIRSQKKEYIKKESLEFIDNKITELIKGINGYIKFLRTKAETNLTNKQIN